MPATEIDQNRLETFLHKMVGDMGAAMGGPLVVLGDKLGLYKGIRDGSSVTSEELAQRTGTNERYVREWLAQQAASGYVNYDAAMNRYSMTPEQVMVFADDDSPAFMVGAFDAITSMYWDEPKITDAFRSGAGVAWGEHSTCLFCGTERFFKSGYTAHLVDEWIPALDGMKNKLEQGAKVADIGCGHGAATMIMGKAFPNSQFTGFDFHGPSIEHAGVLAEQAGVAGNVKFAVASAKDFPGQDWDLLCHFDCLHDMGDPAGAARHARQALKPDGTWMIVEPFAHDELEDNLNPVGRMFYAASTMICTPASKAQEVGLCLGAQAGEKRLREVVTSGGFARFRRATETPFNLILEARP